MKKKKEAFLPYAFSSEGAAAFRRYTRLVTLAPALVSLWILFPLSTIFSAHRLTALSYIVSFLGEFLSAAALFLALALLVVATLHGEAKAKNRLLLWQLLAVLFIGMLGRVLLYLLMALPEHLSDGAVKLTVDTWRDLTVRGEILSILSYAFLGALSPMAVFLITMGILRRRQRRAPYRGQVEARTLLIPVLVYLIFGLVFAGIETVVTITSYGFSFGAGTLFDLFMPYLLLSLITVAGNVLLKKAVAALEKTVDHTTQK